MRLEERLPKHTAPQDQLELGTQPQTARAPVAGERWPVLRSPNPDREIPGWLWHAVADRDDWTCKICHEARPSWSRAWEIDHIVPWSAGGSDDSTNLRLTCAGCNQRRRNYADPFARPMPPIINRCEWDYGPPRDTRVWCAMHKRWETAPNDYARRYELASVIQRREIEAAKAAAAEALTAWQRKEAQ